MRDLTRILEDPVWLRAGWALASFLWQGALVAGAFAVFNGLFARRDPRIRYAAGCAAMLLMLACPIATFLGSGSPFASSDPAPISNRTVVAAPESARIAPEADSPAARIARTVRTSATAFAPWFAPFWAAGVLALSLRFLCGWSVARRLTRRGATPAPDRARRILERLAETLGVRRPVVLLESAAVAVPTALGALKPAILLPLSALTGLSPEGLEAVLAHELAHVRRRDYLVNLLQTAVETLLFYHPAVWWVSHRVRVERENCCDDLAVAVTGDARAYARALVGLEEIRAARPALAVAASGGSLLQRIARLLPAAAPRPERGTRWLAGILSIVAIGALGAAARVPALIDSPGVEPALAASPAASPEPEQAAEPAAPAVAAVLAGVPGGVRGGVPGGVKGGVHGGVRAAVAGGVAGGVSGALSPSSGESPDPGEEKSGGRQLTPDELARLRRHGVTPEFLDSLTALGYKRASLDDIVSLQIHGVTPEYISAMTGLFGRISLDELTSLKIHGVSPEFVRAFREAGYAQISADEARSLRIHGVAPDSAGEWQKLLGRRTSLDEIVSARIHDATPDYAKEMRSLGLETDLDGFVSMRIHGVMPDFVRAIRALGYSRLSVDEVTSLKIHGVTPEFAKEVHSLGYKGISLDELTSLRIHGVTTDFIREANRSVSPRLSVDELLDRRIHWRK